MKTTKMIRNFVRRSLIAAPLALAPALSVVVLESAGIKAPASFSAAAQDDKAKTEYKTKKSYSLRQKVFKDFAPIQELTDTEDWNGALQVLNDLQRKKVGDYTSFEKANLWNYYGWIYYSLENYPESIKYYERVLKEDELSDALQLGTLYTLAQLKFVQEDYRGAVGHLEEWMRIQPIVGADAYALISQGYYQLGDMDKSLQNINTAVDKFESTGKIPKENWYSLQRAIYFDRKDNKKVIDILIKLVRHYPKAVYWKQLSGLYGLEEREEDQLFAFEVVYLMGAAEKEQEIVNLAYMYLGQDIPYKAAKVLDKGIKDGIVKESSKNLELLANSWRMAQEIDKSIPEMEKAASKSDDGDLYARLASIYLDAEKYDKALASGNKARNRGGIKRSDNLAVVMGMAYTNKKQYDKAIKEFRTAAKDKRSKKFADQWIRFARAELEREKALKI